jgi:hypothetical protein
MQELVQLQAEVAALRAELRAHVTDEPARRREAEWRGRVLDTLRQIRDAVRVVAPREGGAQ